MQGKSKAKMCLGKATVRAEMQRHSIALIAQKCGGMVPLRKATASHGADKLWKRNG